MIRRWVADMHTGLGRQIPLPRHASSAVGRAVVMGLGVVVGGMAAASTPTPYLDLEARIPLQGLGVGLDIDVAPEGKVYVGSRSKGLWYLRRDGGWGAIQVREVVGRGRERHLRLHPERIAAGSGDTVWAVEPDKARVLEIDPQGHVRRRYGASDGLHEPSFAVWRPMDGLAIWDKALQRLVSPGRPVPQEPLQGGPYTLCTPGDSIYRYCIRAAGTAVVALAGGQAVATVSAREGHAKWADLTVDPEGQVYAVDPTRRRIYRFEPGLAGSHRLVLYEDLFTEPTRVAVADGSLWLIDEGRKVLYRYRIRKAVTGLEHRLLGEEQLAVGAFESALATLRKAQALGDQDPSLGLNMGRALYGLGRYQEALAALEQAARVPGAMPEAELWKAHALFRLGRYAEAAAIYRRLSAHPRLGAVARFDLGQAWLAQGQYIRAREVFEALHREEPGRDSYRLGLARALAGLGDRGQAERLLKEIDADSPLFGRAQYERGELYRQAGRLKEARSALEVAARRGPIYRRALLALADVYQRLGDPARAEVLRSRVKQVQEAAASGAWIEEGEL